MATTELRVFRKSHSRQVRGCTEALGPEECHDSHPSGRATIAYYYLAVLRTLYVDCPPLLVVLSGLRHSRNCRTLTWPDTRPFMYFGLSEVVGGPVTDSCGSRAGPGLGLPTAASIFSLAQEKSILSFGLGHNRARSRDA